MARKSIQLGILQLNNATPERGFVVSNTNIWNLAERDLNLQPKLQDAGSVSLFQRYKHRKIIIEGFVRDADSDSFERQLNELKVYGLEHQIDLVVDFWGGELTYKVAMMDFEPMRKHMPNFANYKLVLVAPSPFGNGTMHGTPNTGVFADDAVAVNDFNRASAVFYTHDNDKPNTPNTCLLYTSPSPRDS